MPLQAPQDRQLQQISWACAHHLASLTKHSLIAFYAGLHASSHHAAYTETALCRAAFCVWTQSAGGWLKPPDTLVVLLSRLLPLLSKLALFPSESRSSCSPSLPGKSLTLWSCGSFSLLLALPVSVFMKPRTSGIFQSDGSKYFTSCNTHTDVQIHHTHTHTCTKYITHMYKYITHMYKYITHTHTIYTHIHVHKHTPYTQRSIQRQTCTHHMIKLYSIIQAP